MQYSQTCKTQKSENFWAQAFSEEILIPYKWQQAAASILEGSDKVRLEVHSSQKSFIYLLLSYLVVVM